MTEFKQIIGRGTRVRDDYGKYYFNILDYTGSATRHFADPEFDGEPTLVAEITIDEQGNTESEMVVEEEPGGEPEDEIRAPAGVRPTGIISERPEEEIRKFYVDGGCVEVAAQLVYELDASGKQLRVVKYTDYTADTIRTLFPTAAALRQGWSDFDGRNEIIDGLSQRGIDFEQLEVATGQPGADPFDLLCHVAYNSPLRTRRERAERLRRDHKDFFDKYGTEAQAVLSDLLDKYSEHGVAQFKLPDVLQVPPISERGNVAEVIHLFGDATDLRNAVASLQELLYAA